MKRKAAQLRLAWVREGLIAGVDEAGRGPLAGPVVAAAVILDPRRRLRGVRDSKQIADPAERTVLAKRIRASAISWSVAWADVEEIDSLNILQATYLAMRRALCGLCIPPEHVQIDGNTCPLLTNLGLHCTFEPIIGGDASHANIGAASILAKTTRDAMMLSLDSVYPGYGFASHKGYATPEHYRALDRHGPTPIHRRSFEPVRLAREAMTSVATHIAHPVRAEPVEAL